MTAEWMPLLDDGLAQLGLRDADGVSSLLNYIGELERWSERLGLVHAQGRDLIVRHILDSLAGHATIRKLCAGGRTTIADVGSGGGLPGIPLACFLPDAHVTLVERSERKCGFLRGAVLTAGLRNAEAVSADYKSLDQTYDIIVFRAFQPLSPPLLKGLTRILSSGGVLCAYKGRRDKIQEEQAILGEAMDGFSLEVIPVAVPHLDEERNLMIIGRAEES